MADFNFLEKIAARIKENRAKLAQLEESLAYVNTEIHEIPLKRNTESTFAKIIGIGYDDRIDEIKKSKDNLENQIKNLSDAVTSDMSSFISEISSPDLVIPLEPNPNLKEGKIIYKYRDGAKFNNIFDVLSELLGLSAPLVVKDGMLSSTEITIATREEFEAKQKFISAMNEIQKINFALQKLILFSSFSVTLKTFFAINWSVLFWLEWYFTFDSTVTASCFEHFSTSSIP